MDRLHLIILALLGAVLFLLIANHDGGNTMGMRNESLASGVYLLCWAVFIFGGMMASSINLRQGLQMLLMWAVIIMGFMTAYLYRYEAQDFGHRLSAGLIPPSPLSRAKDGELETVTLVKANDGHFHANATVNGTGVRFLIDTGASMIALSNETARDLGIDVDNLSYVLPVNTANGSAFTARARIDAIRIEGIVRRDLPVRVSQAGALDDNLLGNTFLDTLSSYEVRGDRLILRD